MLPVSWQNSLHSRRCRSYPTCSRFFCFSLVFRLCCRLFRLGSTPYLSCRYSARLNRAAGLAFGILVGALYAWVISYVLLLSVPYLSLKYSPTSLHRQHCLIQL